tara:strand:+ start:166 stop:357 length:192 start_codon:yes stop_codon:yes gene_type:complete
MSGYWTDAEGSEIKIEYMTDSHLANSISFLDKRYREKKNSLLPVVYYELVKEYKRRMELIKNG